MDSWSGSEACTTVSSGPYVCSWTNAREDSNASPSEFSFKATRPLTSIPAMKEGNQVSVASSFVLATADEADSNDKITPVEVYGNFVSVTLTESSATRLLTAGVISSLALLVN